MVSDHQATVITVEVTPTEVANVGEQPKMAEIKGNVTSIVVLVIESQDLSSTPLGGTFDFLQG